jgi:uncharacterized membrane protein
MAVVCVAAFPTVLDVIGKIGLLSKKHLDTLLDTEGSIINVKFFASAILTAVYAVNYYRNRQRRDKFLCFLMLVGTIYSAIGFYSGYVGRMANFFWVFIIIALADLIGQLSSKKYSRIVISLLVGVLYFVCYFAVLGFDVIIPYDIAI